MNEQLNNPLPAITSQPEPKQPIPRADEIDLTRCAVGVPVPTEWIQNNLLQIHFDYNWCASASVSDNQDQFSQPLVSVAQLLHLRPPEGNQAPTPQEDNQAPTERPSCARQSAQLVGHCSRYLIACCCISASAVCCAGITSAGLYLIGAATLPISKACLIGKCGSGCTCCGCQKELATTIFKSLQQNGVNARTSSFVATSTAGACFAAGAVIPVSVCCALSDT